MHDDDQMARTFHQEDLRDTRFVDCDLTGLTMRGVEMRTADIDSPWLFDDAVVLVNGVDVMPYVVAQVNAQFPGRALKDAQDPDGLRAAWTALEEAWAAAVDRAAQLPDGAVDVQVDEEWSFAQTLRHLVLATDLWFGYAILKQERSFHPLGIYDESPSGFPFAEHGLTRESAAYADVLSARASRQAMVREFLASVTPQILDEERSNPHAPQHPQTVRSCLHTILEEEWEHLRFATRDLASVSSPSV